MIHIAHRLRHRFPDQSRYVLPALVLVLALALAAGLMPWVLK